MAGERLFKEIKERFVKRVNLSEGTTAICKAIDISLREANKDLVRKSKAMVRGIEGLSATTFLGVTVTPKGSNTRIQGALTLPVNGMLKQYPVLIDVSKEVEIPNLDELVKSAYYQAKKEGEYYHTKDSLNDRFTEVLNDRLPKNGNLRVIGSVDRAHTDKVSFNLVFTGVNK